MPRTQNCKECRQNIDQLLKREVYKDVELAKKKKTAKKSFEKRTRGMFYTSTSRWKYSTHRL